MSTQFAKKSYTVSASKSKRGLGSPNSKARSRQTVECGFFVGYTQGCSKHPFVSLLYGWACRASKDAPFPLSGLPTCNACPPSWQMVQAHQLIKGDFNV